LTVDAGASFRELLQIVEDIRDAFCILAQHAILPRNRVLASVESLLNSYDHLPVCVSALNTILNGVLDPIVEKLTRRGGYDQRTLRWIAKKVQARFAENEGGSSRSADDV